MTIFGTPLVRASEVTEIVLKPGDPGFMGDISPETEHDIAEIEANIWRASVLAPFIFVG